MSIVGPRPERIEHVEKYSNQIPEFVFLDEYGNQIGESYIGSRSYEEWVTIIQPLLGE